MSNNGCMSIPKRDKRKGDRHKPGRAVRVRLALLPYLDMLAARTASTAPEVVNRAVRELLEREGLWPPTKPTP